MVLRLLTAQADFERKGRKYGRATARVHCGPEPEFTSVLRASDLPGAAATVEIAPCPNMFRAVCAICGVLVLWTLYRRRVRQIEAAIGVRFDERLAERTRLARDIHDTLLQTPRVSRVS